MIQEKIIVGEHTEYPLKGILTLPDDTTEKLPAVIFVHGSGSSNMDEKVGKLTPFKDLAEGLAKHGIASIRYDKRSFTHGLKMVKSKQVITVKEETIEDALMATQLLREDPRIDSDKIFIIGHSMGGMLAPRIHCEGGNYRGIIIMAGSCRKLEEIMMTQNESVLSEVNFILKWIINKQLNSYKKMFDSLYEISDEQAKSKKMGNGVTLYYFKEMGEHPASDYLKNIDTPILILQGEKDFQATVKHDFNSYKEILKDQDNVTYQVYENLNHAFVSAISEHIMKAKQEYNKERHIPEHVISDIANWIKEN